jgi:hypothetical protein
LERVVDRALVDVDAAERAAGLPRVDDGLARVDAEVRLDPARVEGFPEEAPADDRLRAGALERLAMSPQYP